MIKKDYQELVLQVLELANDVLTDSADTANNGTFLEGAGQDDIFG